MALDGASAARADIVYPRLNVIVDTGAGIDVRNLDDVNGATNDATTTATALATNDNVERTFDPATGAVTNTNNAGTTLFRTGWAFPVADMAPADDTACNAAITAQTLNVKVNMSLNWSSSLADPATGTVAITFRASLWRYNPSTDAGVLIAAGSVATPTWNIATVGGDAKGTFKQATIPITVTDTEFLTGEVMLLQVGFNTGTLPNPLSGTTTYTFALQVDSASTLVDFAAGEGIRLACTKSDTCVGEGLVSAPLKQATLARTATGEGLVTFTKAASVFKTFNLIGEGLVSRTLAVGEFFDLIGEGLVSMTRVVVASKTFTLIGEGLVPTTAMAVTMSRTATGEGIVTLTKASNVSKTFNLIGEGLVTLTKNTQAVRTFNLAGEGVVTRQMSLTTSLNVVGEGLVTFTKGVIASKTFTLLGEGVVTMGRDNAFTFNLIGEGLVTEVHPVSAFRTFNLIGEGIILTTGPNASMICMPIDEVPEGGGGGTIIVKKPVFIFDD